ncbi:hypothetical protein Ancab_004137 [Ancistrocladus abbreviatus]
MTTQAYANEIDETMVALMTLTLAVVIGYALRLARLCTGLANMQGQLSLVCVTGYRGCFVLGHTGTTRQEFGSYNDRRPAGPWHWPLPATGTVGMYKDKAQSIGWWS